MQGPFIAGYSAVEGPYQESYGLQRLDHAVGNVHRMLEAIQYIGTFTGFHEFAEFTAEDVGTVDSGESLESHAAGPYQTNAVVPAVIEEDVF